MAAAYAARAGDHLGVSALVETLVADGLDAIGVEIGQLLERQIASAWVDGWQPVDVARVVDRELGKIEGALIRSLVAAQAASYEALAAKVAPGWLGQLQRIGAVRTWRPDRPWLAQLGRGSADVLHAAVSVMQLLMALPKLPLLTDPPSSWRVGGATVDAGSLPDGVLEKVRALLAKAESTTFQAEADACTAKAQELMARHRIDRAVLDAGRRDGERPGGRRMGVDDPYADAKAMLLCGIATANGCQAVWSKGFGFCTVFGFVNELDAVEELFTSLLVQASAALQREGAKFDRYGRSRTTRFRRSFLVAFAVRIGDRLRETVDATVEAVCAEAGTALVPILTARNEASAAAAEAAFPVMGKFSPSATDGEGWRAGTIFASHVNLGLGPELTRETA